MDELDLRTLLQLYKDKFGMTFDWFRVADRPESELKPKLQQALERGEALTNEDFGLSNSYPPNVQY